MERIRRGKVQNLSEKAELGRGSQSPEESNSFLTQSSTCSPNEDLLQRVERLQAEVMHLAEVDIPELQEQELEPARTANVTKILTKLCQKENAENLYMPEYTLEQVLKLIDEDLENCNLLINSLTEQFKKELEIKKQVKEQHEILSMLFNDLDNISEDSSVNISRKVNVMFKNLRNELKELVSLWAGDDEEECIQLLASLTSAYHNEPGSNGQYVDVSQFERKIVQMLVVNRIAIWNKEQTHLRLII